MFLSSPSCCSRKHRPLPKRSGMNCFPSRMCGRPQPTGQRRPTSSTRRSTNSGSARHDTSFRDRTANNGDRVKFPLDIGRPSLTENYHAQAVTGSTQVNAYLPVIWCIEPAIGEVQFCAGVRRAYVALIAPTGKVPSLLLSAFSCMVRLRGVWQAPPQRRVSTVMHRDLCRFAIAPAIALMVGAMGGCSRRSPVNPCCRRQIRAVNIVLSGSTLPATKTSPSAFTMAPYDWLVSDQDLADVVSSIQTSCGNVRAVAASSKVTALRKAAK